MKRERLLGLIGRGRHTLVRDIFERPKSDINGCKRHIPRADRSLTGTSRYPRPSDAVKNKGEAEIVYDILFGHAHHAQP